MPPQQSGKPFILPRTSAREVIIAVAAGLALLGFVIWGILLMSHDVSGHSLLKGTIISRHFEPQPPEEQLTVGKGGLDERNIDGIYTMEVRTPDGRTYKVFVEKPIYQSHNTGDELSFLPPPARQP